MPRTTHAVDAPLQPMMPAAPAPLPSFVIETPRLQLRRIQPADVAALFAVYGDAEAMRWVGDGEPLSRDDCERWVEVSHRNYAARGYGMFAVVLAATGVVIGFCGLVHPAGQASCELKYAYRREHWGQGYASEAATALLAHGAAAFGVRQAIATTAPDNLASQRVLLKAGMHRGELRRNEDGSFTQVFCWPAVSSRD